MSVVLRCPSCGTTRPTPGQCEACHEAEARYFCTNHTPGVWVDAPTCPKCGGRFGEVRRPPAPVPGPPVRTRPLEPARTPPSLSPPRSRSERPEPPLTREEWAAREAFPPAREEGPAMGVSPLALLLNILTASARRPAPMRMPHRGRGIGGGAIGCFIQIVVAIVSLLSALFFFGW